MYIGFSSWRFFFSFCSAGTVGGWMWLAFTKILIDATANMTNKSNANNRLPLPLICC